ncbi:SYCN protein, partial [Odontophorus gujanensis]|nr:SYCN protein [Odontophorus gujanensis]
CPTAADLNPSNGTRLCAQLYTEDSAYYNECCSGSSLAVLPDSDVPYMTYKWAGKISSLVVGTRCELTVWSRAGKEGNSKKFSA